MGACFDREHERIVDLVSRARYGEAATYLREVHWSFDVQSPYIRAYYHMDDPRAQTVAAAGPPRRSAT